MKEIMKHLEAITRKGFRPQQVFDDWVHLMTYALLHDDERYLERMKRYRNDAPRGDREADHFAVAFGLLLQRMAKTNEETLGEIYEQWEIANKYSGQFFTPAPVCDLMAQITGVPSPGSTVSDPCCGSGRLLIATAKITPASDLSGVTFVAQDIDPTCVMMCALNFTFFNLNGYVLLGNSLGMKVRRAFRTIRTSIGGSIMEIDPATVAPAPPEPDDREEKHDTNESDQQMLFEESAVYERSAA